MKNNTKKAPVKFWEDLLFFLAFYADFCFCSKLVIITTLRRLSISYENKATDEDVHRKIQIASGEHDELDCCKEMETKVVLTHLNVFWFSKGDFYRTQ